MPRHYINTLFCFSNMLAVGLCLLVLVFLLGRIGLNGIQAIDMEFLSSRARNFGTEGGILYQILGTLLIITFAAIISLPLAIGTALFQSEYLKSPGLQKGLKILIYGLNGIPSIIFGVFGLIFFINILETGISWFVGSIILALMILPTVIMATYQAIHSIPDIYRESALALGLTRWQVIVKVLIPQGFSGAVTGLLLGLARAAGETAPIMFIATAFSGVGIPYSFLEPVTTLPTHILALSQQATNPQALQNAWGASLVLLGIVMILSSLGLWARTRSKIVSYR